MHFVGEVHEKVLVFTPPGCELREVSERTAQDKGDNEGDGIMVHNAGPLCEEWYKHLAISIREPELSGAVDETQKHNQRITNA